MDSKAKVLDQKIQDEMVGVLTAISIVAKRLAGRLSQLNEDEEDKKSSSSSESEVKV